MPRGRAGAGGLEAWCLGSGRGASRHGASGRSGGGGPRGTIPQGGAGEGVLEAWCLGRGGGGGP
ncbi:hypothetical protein KY290_001797 [Solanum tuberosum]|uniref:Uncharacterized protein n=1 Tax=Solanum tuberosum TaxID=4113 RepID=A0ABQ7WN94_SOLTU|nr:hypothetical protein KY290_001797 [Solanum tuberosum]